LFRAIIFSAVFAGLIGGVVATVVQSIKVTPLIREAETYEAAARAPTVNADGHDHQHAKAWTPDGTFETTLGTLGANTLAAIGFALLVTAAMTLHGEANWYRGLLWGVGGFASFSLAPAVGLPPELPGMAAADLVSRQAWWIGTAIATAAGLTFLFLIRRPAWATAGAILIAAPHLIGAPHGTGAGAGVPPELIIEFGIASLISNLLLWAALGIASGILLEKLRPDDEVLP
jgi:cobalt transporter subunit CbtA